MLLTTPGVGKIPALNASAVVATAPYVMPADETAEVAEDLALEPDDDGDEIFDGV